MMPHRVLVTRPAAQAAALAQRLQQAGFAPVCLPMLAIAGIDPAEHSPAARQARACISQLWRYRRIVFISTNAVEYGLHWMRACGGRLAADAHVYAIGPATAGALAWAGIEAEQPAQATDSDSLLALPALQQLAGERILIIRGAGGLGRLAEGFAARGARVDVAETYRRVRPQHSAQDCRAALQPLPAAALVASGETLENLAGYLPDAGLRAALPLVVPGDRVAALARQLGFRTVWVAHGAGDHALCAALQHHLPGPEGSPIHDAGDADNAHKGRPR